MPLFFTLPITTSCWCAHTSTLIHPHHIFQCCPLPPLVDMPMSLFSFSLTHPCHPFSVAFTVSCWLAHTTLFNIHATLFNIAYCCLLFSIHLTTLTSSAYAIKNSPTIIQPKWKKTLLKLVVKVQRDNQKALTVPMMPWDIATHWNSTYEMLKFAFSYWEGSDNLADDWMLKLCDYELRDEDWKIVKQLHDSLKVSNSFYDAIFF